MSRNSETLRELRDYPAAAVRAYCENVGLKYGLETFEEAFCGEWDSEADFAAELAADCGIVPKDGPARTYFDWDAWTQDLFLGDYTSIKGEDGKLYVFQNI